MDKIEVLSGVFYDVINGIKKLIALVQEFVGGIDIKYGWQKKDDETTTDEEVQGE